MTHNSCYPTISLSILINMSRGQVVDEKALISALEKGKITAAGLDVFEKEPNVSPGLMRLENVVLLPHIGSLTIDTREQMAIMAAKNAVSMAKGNPPFNIVNPKVLESPQYHQRIGRDK